MKKKGKLVLGAASVLGVGLISVAALTGCSSSVASYNSWAQVVVSDSSSVLNDQSFTYTSYLGLQEFMKDQGKPMPDAADVPAGNGIWSKPMDAKPDTFIKLYQGLVNDGAKVLIAPGFNEQASIQTAVTSKGSKDSFKNSGFIEIDGIVDGVNRDKDYNQTSKDAITNVSSVEFHVDSAGWLAGVSTAEMLNENLAIFGSDGLNVGGYVGQAYSSTLSFLAGFQQGIAYYNANILAKEQVSHKDYQKVNWLAPNTSGHTTNAGDYASGNFAVTDGTAKQFVTNLINNHADVILPVAGPQTPMVVSLAKTAKNPTMVIGVDTAQEKNNKVQQSLKTSSVKLVGGEKDFQNDIIQMSIQKSLDVATNGMLEAITSQDSLSKDKSWHGFGWANVATLANKGVKLSKSGVDWLVKAMKNVDPSLTDYAKVTAYVDTSIHVNNWLAINGDVTNVTTKNKEMYYWGVEKATLENYSQPGGIKTAQTKVDVMKSFTKDDITFSKK